MLELEAVGAGPIGRDVDNSEVTMQGSTACLETNAHQQRGKQQQCSSGVA